MNKSLQFFFVVYCIYISYYFTVLFFLQDVCQNKKLMLNIINYVYQVINRLALYKLYYYIITNQMMSLWYNSYLAFHLMLKFHLAKSLKTHSIVSKYSFAALILMNDYTTGFIQTLYKYHMVDMLSVVSYPN